MNGNKPRFILKAEDFFWTPSYDDGIPERSGEYIRAGRWWIHEQTGELIPIIAGGTTAAFTQSHARFRNDDGSETTATWRAAEDTNAVLTPDTNYRIRIQVDETAGGASNNFIGVLRYSHNGGAYTAVTDTSSVVRASASGNVTDGEATTNQLTAPAGTFLTGELDEVDGSAGGTQIDFVAGQFTELEYCIQVRSADVAAGDTIDFRVYRGVNVLNVYSVTLRATVAAVRAIPEGSLSAAGIAASLVFAVGLGVGSLGLTGNQVGQAFHGPDSAELAITGQAPTVTVGAGTETNIQIPAGTLALTGHALESIYLFMSPEPGTLALSGQAPTLAYVSPLTQAQLDLTGQTATLAHVLPLTEAALIATGETPALSVQGGQNVTVAPDVAALTFSGQTPSAVLAVAAAPAVGSLALAGSTPTLFVEYRLSPAAATLALDGQAPAVVGSGAIQPDTATLTLAGQAPTVQTAFTLAIPAGGVTFSGQALTASVMVVVSPGAGALALSGSAPSLTGTGSVSPSVAVLTLTGQAPLARVVFGLPVPAGAVGMAGVAPTLSFGQLLSVPDGSLTLSGQAPSLRFVESLALVTGTLTLSGQVPSLAMGSVSLPVGTLTLTGYAPAVIYVGTPQDTIIVRASDTTVVVGAGVSTVTVRDAYETVTA